MISESAQKQFDLLTQQLNDEELTHLRIEKGGKFNIVRVGKFDDLTAANKVLHKVKSISPEAFVLKDYLKDERIIRSYKSGDLPAKGQSSEGKPLRTSKPSEARPQQPTQKPPSSDNPEASHAKAKEMAKTGDFKQAISLLSPFVSDPMKYPEIFSDYLVMLVWDGKYDNAIELYEKLPPSFPKRPYLMRNIAKAYYEKKRFSTASPLYQSVVEQSPSDGEAQKGLVLSLMGMDDYLRASDYAERFIEKNPDNISLIFIKAHLLFSQGKYYESLKTYNAIAARKDAESEKAYGIRDNLITSVSGEKLRIMLSDLASSSEKDEETKQNYMLSLILHKEYNKAINFFEDSKIRIENYSDNLLSWIAWAYFKTGNTEKAKLYYNKVLSAKPKHIRANSGLAYVLATDGQGETAINILNKLIQADPKNLELRFSLAFVYEKLKRFWSAIEQYDRILEIAPKNVVATKLKLQALSDLGASSISLEEAYKDLPDDSKLHTGLKGDMAVDRINWEEPAFAISILSPLIEDRNNMRARYDHIVALAENDDMEKVIKLHEDFIKERISPPHWVLENVAKAYLYLEQPDKALELYNEALKMAPASFNGRMGKFYALQELRRWNEARELLDTLDKEIPNVFGEGVYVRPNWLKLDIIEAKPWLLAYEERVREAEESFWDLRERAPASMGIRSGLSHVYYWRGWPRKALREFNITETLEGEKDQALIGKAAVLNELAFKEEAREIAGKLLSKYPNNKHVQQLVRRFKVEEMREFYADFVYTRDEDGFEDIRAEASLSQPLSLYTNLYGWTLWQRSSDDEHKEFYRRAGIGITHIFNSSWTLKQQFSIDYDEGDDFGSLTLLNFYPDDHWRLNISYDSFTTDVPLRARVFGIESDKLETGITYRESDWRSYHLTLSRMKFSDDNRRESALLGYEQGLFVKNDWKMRFFLDLYASRNSLDDTPYFNPAHDFSLSVTHMTENILWRIYNQAFVHKLFLTLGTYKQSGYANDLIWAIKYQHDYDFSDTHALIWGVTLARNVYDGDPVHTYNFYLTYRWRF